MLLSTYLWFLRNRLFSKITCYLAPATNQIKQLRQSLIKCGELLNKHFCKKIPNIPNETEKIVNFLFSHYKSMGTISCHSNQSSFPIGIKKTTFRSPNLKMLYVKYEKNWPHGFRGEDGQWTTDGRRIPSYTISSPMSLRLR